MSVKPFLVIAIIILLNGCSGTYNSYYQTLKIAFSEQGDAQKTLVEIQQSDVDIISVKRGDRPTAIMALAYLESGQHKWVSNDNAMLIMQKGRLIRSLGLSDNRLYLSNLDNDPLKFIADKIPNEKRPKIWLRIADRHGDEYGHPIHSIFSVALKDSVQVLELSIDSHYYVETVNYNAPTNYLRLDNSWENHFWYSKDGVLIKSIQQISPLSEPIEIIYLSRIARLIP
jgi:hypothetical protein